MKKNITKFLSCLAAVAFLGGTQVEAQKVAKVTITSPESVAGDYIGEIATFGKKDYTSETGELVLVDDQNTDDNSTATDGCTEIKNDVEGKIAVIDRGSCPFVDKATNASNAKAIVMLVCNNVDGAPVVMPGTVEVTPACLMLSKADCDKIKVAMGAGSVSATITQIDRPCPEREYDEAVFWGNEKGQGDFDGGLNGWTTINVAPPNRDDVVWESAPDGRPVFGQFFGSGHVFESAPTACNGVATFSFVKHAIGDNPSPTQPYTTYNAELISPVIDCTGKDFISLEYFQAYNKLNSISQIAYSTDGGATWSEPINAPYEGALNEVVDDRKVTLPLPALENQAECRIKFIANGDFYYWSIDDVTLRSEEIRDVQINQNFYATAPSVVTPKELVTEIPFLCDIQNVGNSNLEGVKVVAQVLKGDQELSSQTYDYGTVKGGEIIENKHFPQTYTLPNEDGEYTIRYTISCDGGDNEENNVVESKVYVGGRVLSKQPVREGTPYFTSAWRSGDNSGTYYSYGNYFAMPTTKWADGTNIVLDKVNFFLGINDEEPLGSAIVNVYGWEDTNNDRIAQSTEINPNLLASGKTAITKDNKDSEFVVELLDADDEESKYVFDGDSKPGIIVVVHTNNSKEDDSWFYGAMNSSNAGFYQYNNTATSLAFENLGIKNYGSFQGVRADKDVEEVTLENSGLTWYTPLTLTTEVSVNEINKDVAFTAYPNPTVNTINVDLPELVRAEGTAIIKVYDATGKNVISRQYTASETISVNVSTLAAGTYTMKLESKEGYNTTTFVVGK